MTTIVVHTCVNPDFLPLSWKVLLSGYAAEYIYERGRLDPSLPFEELRRRSQVNDAALAGMGPPISRGAFVRPGQA
jgi:hypothetical protein